MGAFTRILLIEDDAITITICERLIKISNFAAEVIACSDGHQAATFLQDNIAGMPEIILVDLHMGVMNGWQFLDWYENWATSLSESPPVYVLSSSLSNEDVKRSEKYTHVKGYIIKPITVKHLGDITAHLRPE